MTKPPDIEAIAALAREAKARADRATPGQWVCGARWQRGPKDKRRDDHPGLTAIAGVGLGQYVLTEHDGGVYPANDQRFIAAARTDVPALADAVLALVERVRELEAWPVMPETPSEVIERILVNEGWDRYCVRPNWDDIRAAIRGAANRISE